MSELKDRETRSRAEVLYCLEAVRLILKMRAPVDFAVTKRTNENLRRLLEEGESAS